jgi:hypothetical protein
MKQGRTLPELATELQRQANAKHDFVVPAEHLRVISNGHSHFIMDDVYELTDVAHGQLAEYAGVPKPYYDRLRGSTDDLRVTLRGRTGEPGENGLQDSSLFDVTLNAILRSKQQDRRLVRTLDGKARAFLSDSFNVDLDNYDVFRVAARVIEEEGLGPDDVISTEVTERRLYIKVVSPRMQAVVQPTNLQPGHPYLKEPQTVQAGFIISNSEVGLGSLSVQQTVYKLICTNLWIREEAYRQRHLGKVLEADDDGAVYRSDTRAADAKARLLKVRDHVAGALDQHKFMALVSKMQNTAEVKLDGGVEKVVDSTARRFGLTQDEKESVLRNLIEGADLSLWGLSNAITATAQTVSSYDRATELQAIGGKFFELPPAEVKELARAA